MEITAGNVCGCGTTIYITNLQIFQNILSSQQTKVFSCLVIQAIVIEDDDKLSFSGRTGD